ncbi:hypothetical protein ACT3CE_00195 [Marinifilum sp. RC60d5]|uniref:hypothetical protein n=1 Tax=Marinifilum sp. RC60d5 TaxID=3458414 RepID=UPI0040374554
MRGLVKLFGGFFMPLKIVWIKKSIKTLYKLDLLVPFGPADGKKLLILERTEEISLFIREEEMPERKTFEGEK